MEFKSGDKVRLVTGYGPIMVVVKREGQRYRCRWWSDKNDRFEQQLFLPEEIEPYQENK